MKILIAKQKSLFLESLIWITTNKVGNYIEIYFDKYLTDVLSDF